MLGKLEAQWKSGALRNLESDLDRFIRDNQRSIRTVLRKDRPKALDVARRRYRRGEISDRDLLDITVRSLLAQKRSCNPAGDIREQLAEIQRGMDGGSSDRQCREKAVQTWAVLHARDWREWRLYQTLYVWQKKSDQYLRLLSAPASLAS